MGVQDCSRWINRVQERNMKVFDVFQRPASDGLIRCSPSEVSARAAVHEEIIGIGAGPRKTR